LPVFPINKAVIFQRFFNMSNKVVDISATNANRIERISKLVESLQQKIRGFTVLDKQGQLVGKVINLNIDANRQLNFVIQKSEIQESNRLFLLNSRLIEKIDSQARRILINVSKGEVESLPEYVDRESQVSTMENNSDAFNANTQEGTPFETLASGTHNEIDSVDEIIRLLGERIIVDRNKRRVGEVIVRKQIETQMVQVPVRREKLIVEQVTPEHRQLAEIDLSQGDISGVELVDGETSGIDHKFNSSLTVTGEFSSPKIASLLLNAIALERNHGCKAIRVTVLVENEERKQTYQEWFDRTSKG
jgi:stress response protein YsnF